MLIGLEGGKDLIEVIEVDEGQAQAIINQVTVKLAEAEQNPPAPETEDAPAQAAEEKVEEAEQAPPNDEEKPPAADEVDEQEEQDEASEKTSAE